MPDSVSAVLERRLGADVSAAVRGRLAAFAQCVLRAGFNLTAARTPEAFAEHIADALTLLPYVRGPLIDVGSGAGLPGIPLAIVTGEPVVLVEAVRKKAEFLAATLEQLDLPGEAVAERAEVVGHRPAYREQAMTATARAVGSAPAVLELTVPLVACGGVVLLPRGELSMDERNAVRDAAPMLGAEFVEEVPLEGQRRILVIAKRTRTPGRFPRRTGVPDKRPLCFT